MPTVRGFELLGGGSISSIQRGYYTGESIDDSSGTITYRDITISPVDLSKSMLFCIGTGITATEYFSQYCRAYLLNSTTLRVLRSRYNISTPRKSIFQPFRWQVVELSNIKSVQRGVFDNTSGTVGTPKDITISSVDLDKTILNCIGLGNANTGGSYGSVIGDAYLLNDTTIRVPYHHELASSYAWEAFTWEVIEFN